MHLYRLRLAAVLALVAIVSASGGEPDGALDESRILPSEHPAIDYWNADPDDAVARLQRRLDSGEVTLDLDGAFGYLPSVLDALDVPVSSQVLVFSKTSFQASRIVPRMPRAIYHSDSVSVGWVRGGDVLEVASLDPKLGVVFYTLDQTRSSRPRFRLRTTECISCHVGRATLGVPGLMVRSVHPDLSGTPQRTPTFITDHRSPLEERWGGWYVSGEHGSQQHLGNVIFEIGRTPTPLIGDRALNVAKLEPYVSSANYLWASSDIVSLMVLEHQTRMTNLIVRLGYEARIAQHDKVGDAGRNPIAAAAEELVRYMLFTDEARLDAPVRGDAAYVRDFESAGRLDSQGRSLRQLDLQSRLMRYPCSYMVYSEAFEALPRPAKDLVYQRLWSVLTGKDSSETYAALSESDRKAILEILCDTKDDLPAYWSN